MIKQPKPTWTYSHEYSDSDSQIYVHTFPILKYKKYTVLDGEFIYNTTNHTVKVNIYDSKNGTIYAPYYNHNYGDFSSILSKCTDSINRELKKVGITDVNDYNGRV